MWQIRYYAGSMIDSKEYTIKCMFACSLFPELIDLAVKLDGEVSLENENVRFEPVLTPINTDGDHYPYNGKWYATLKKRSEEAINDFIFVYKTLFLADPSESQIESLKEDKCCNINEKAKSSDELAYLYPEGNRYSWTCRKCFNYTHITPDLPAINITVCSQCGHNRLDRYSHTKV